MYSRSTLKRRISKEVGDREVCAQTAVGKGRSREGVGSVTFLGRQRDATCCCQVSRSSLCAVDTVASVSGGTHHRRHFARDKHLFH